MNFRDLNNQEQPLLIYNVWDVASVKIAEELNFDAIGTSSGAIAAMLGYNDGEEMSFTELEYIVKRILASTKLPLSVDLEAGYSKNKEVVLNNIKALINLGVVGVNLEDSLVTKDRNLVDADEFSELIEYLKNELNKEKSTMFLNIRTDAFLLGLNNPVKETLERIKLYENAGADGIFVPCIENKQDIAAIVNATQLPVNVMCMPKLPDFKTLTALGVKRISMGNFVFNTMQEETKTKVQEILNEKSFNLLFN